MVEPVILGPEDVTVAAHAVIKTGPRVSGSLEPQERATVRAEVGGAVEVTSADLGDVVKRGQLLARVEDRTLRESLTSARAAVRTARESLAVAQSEAARTRKLVRAGALPHRERELARNRVAEARAKLEEAQAHLASARKQADDAIVRSPIAGVVSERGVSRGDVVSPGTVLFTIIDPSSMRLSASVPSEALPHVRVGAPVQFKVRGYPGRVFKGVVSAIAPAALAQTREVGILVSIPNPTGELLAGLFADGRVQSTSQKGVVVPLSAVATDGRAPSVRVVRNGQVVETEVILGVRDEVGERVEIQSGVQSGAVLLNGPAMSLPPGTSVRLPEEERPT